MSSVAAVRDLGERVMQGRGARRGVAWLTVLFAMLGASLTGAATAAAGESTVIGQWRFDESGGQTAVDDGPFGMDGRLGLSDAADSRDPSRIAGAGGRALRFDGDSFVRLPGGTALEPARMTLEAVVRAPSSPGKFRYVVSHGAQGCIAGSYGLYTGADGGLAFYVFDGTDYRVTAAIGPADLWNGAWHHVAGVFDGQSLRLYVDGHPVGDPVVAPMTIAYALTSSDAYFGTYQGTCALPLRGDIDLVRLWKGPLAPDFVATLADTALNPSPAPPPAFPAPDGVPVASAGDSNADATAMRSTLTPIAPATSIPATSQPADRVAPPVGAGAPARACSITSTSKRLRARRRTVLTVRVALRGKPVKAARVVATQAVSAHKSRTLAHATTTSLGRARLHLLARERATIVLAVASRTDCSRLKLTVLRARR
jgi:hypothetical protein